MKRNPNDIFLMAAGSLLFSVLVLAQTTFAQNAAGPADPRLGKQVKYTTKQASVQDIVQNLAEQVGLKYDWQKSFNQTDPLCRRWVRNVAIEGKTCREALEQILKPVGLRYQVENGVLVLSREDKGTPSPRSGDSSDSPPIGKGSAWGQSNVLSQAAQPADGPIRLAALHPEQIGELKGRPLCVYNFTTW